MPYRVELKPSVRKELKELPGTVYDRVIACILSLAENPRPYGMKKLTGEDAYRVRVGDHRIIYEIHDDVLLVYVVRIRHRREAY